MCTTNDNAHFSYTPEAIHSILCNNYVDWDTMYRPINNPTWLVKSRTKDKSTLVFTFDSSEKAERFLSAGCFLCLGSRCHTSAYKDKKQAFYCGLCGSLNHHTNNCPKPRCLKCTDPEHEMHEHPDDSPLKCINCGKVHEAKDHACTVYMKKLGIPIPTEKIKIKICIPGVNQAGQRLNNQLTTSPIPSTHPDS